MQGADDSLIGADSAVTLERALRPHYQQRNRYERLRAAVIPGLPHEWVGSPALDALRLRTGAWFNQPGN